MRVRTGLAKLKRANGLSAFFEHAVDRHLAWVIGTGYLYKDLPTVAGDNGYVLWVNDSNQDDTANYWVAVRGDLLDEEGLDMGSDNVEFGTLVKGLGRVAVGSSEEVLSDEDAVLVFYTRDQKSLSVSDVDDRVKLGSDQVKVENNDFEFQEVLYLISAIKD